PQLAHLFDDFNDGPQALTIPVMSIDCGELPEANWEEILTENVLNLVRKELQFYRRPTASGEEQRNHEKQDTRWAEDFIHFLKKGKFQWESRRETIPEFEKWFKPEPALWDELANILHASADAMNRLFHYFSADFILRLTDALVVARMAADDAAYIAFLKQTGVDKATLSRSVITAYAETRGNPVQASQPVSFSAILTSIVGSAIADTADKMEWVQRARSFLKKKPRFVANVLSTAQDEFPTLAEAVQSDESVKPSRGEDAQVNDRKLANLAQQRTIETANENSSADER